MENTKVLILSEELKRLKACETALYYYHRNVKLCPACEKGMLCDDNICTHCDYDGSCSVEEWKQTHEK